MGIVRAFCGTGALARFLLACFSCSANLQHVSFSQRTAFVAAEPAEKVRGRTAEKWFNLDSTDVKAFKRRKFM